MCEFVRLGDHVIRRSEILMVAPPSEIEGQWVCQVFLQKTDPAGNQHSFTIAKAKTKKAVDAVHQLAVEAMIEK